eukprot:EG_transcript_35769
MGIMRSTAWTCVYSVGHPCGMATCFISSTLLQGSGFPSHIGWQSHPVPANCFAKANPMCFKGLLRPVNIPLFRDLPNPLPRATATVPRVVDPAPERVRSIGMRPPV